MFAQPFITFGDMGLIKYVGIRFRPSLLIVFQIVFCFGKTRRAGKTQIPVCLVTVFENYFMFSKHKENKKNRIIL